MRTRIKQWLATGLATTALLMTAPASAAWALNGSKQLALHTRDGQTLPIGRVEFQPDGHGGARFELKFDPARFQEHFLSMRAFKCVDSADEIVCHVPYPYPSPQTVTAKDLRWLESHLIFLYKTPSEFGAKLWNGLYFRMQLGEHGIVGEVETVDLNEISAPPDHPDEPPYPPERRGEVTPGSRWIERLTIE